MASPQSHRTEARQATTDQDIEQLELIAAAGWQPLESHHLGNWVLRAARGFTGRANSALAVGDPGIDAREALHFVVKWYSQRSLTPTLALPLPLRDDLDALATSAGWDRYNLTHVMVGEVPELLEHTQGEVPAGCVIEVGTSPSPAWLQAYRYRGQPLPEGAEQVITNADDPIFVTIWTDDTEVAAIGRAAVTPGWVGITAVEVAEKHRRSGLGTATIHHLLLQSRVRGATNVYLQVAADNLPAQNLYRRLGFTHHHDYVYRSRRPTRVAE